MLCAIFTTASKTFPSKTNTQVIIFFKPKFVVKTSRNIVYSEVMFLFGLWFLVGVVNISGRSKMAIVKYH